MTYLPIVQRELRVAARRKLTHYARGAAALLGIVICGFWLFVLTVLPPSSGTAGGFMFTILSWYTLLATLMAGIFLASDSLSEERREGTLGLLFLTDLKGYDVVLGKFMAVSLNAFYGLLAVFPVLALCMLAGAVSGAELWRTCLALINLLFFSVAVGMLVSSFCRSSFRAIAGSIALLVAWLALTRLLATTSVYYLSNASAFESFLMASDAEYFRQASAYWQSLGISHLIGWFFLACASWRMKSFVDKEKGGGAWQRIFKRGISLGNSQRRAKLLEINPVLWLMDDARRLQWLSWLLTLAGLAVLFFSAKSGPTALMLVNYTMWPVYFLLKIFVAIQACRFFGEARRTGAFELLCCTPVTMRAVLQGQWIALRRAFLWPLIVLLSAHTAALFIMLGKGGGMVAGAPGTGFPMGAFFAFLQFKVIPNNLADFFALGFFGMWLALSMQRPNLSAAVTILVVLILPMVAFCVPTLTTDAIFIVVGWVKLSDDFRLLQAQQIVLKKK